MKTCYTILVVAALFAACTNKVLRKADAHYRHEEFLSAANDYERILKDNPEKNDPKVMLHLADCYRRMNRYADAEKWYRAAISSSAADAEDRLHYAEVLKALGKCDSANLMVDKYLNSKPGDAVAKKMKESCTHPFEKADPFYSVAKMDFGFTGSNFSPVRSGNDLIITASAPYSDGAPMDNFTGNGFYNLYVVSVKDSGNMAMEPSKIAVNNSTSPTVNENGEAMGNANGFSSYKVSEISEITSEYHEGAAVVSPDGKHLFFTRSQMKGNHPIKTMNDMNHLELVEADLVDGKWTNVHSLSFNNNKEYSVGHPAITSDGKRLFFISDKPGGFGGTDIYYSDSKGDDDWSKPVNAGASVNTAGNEMFPVIRSLGNGKDVFYFSSDGLPGDGGLDIFKADMSDNMPGTPERMRSPINSTGDDFGICYSPDGNSGYFSSNRGNTKGVDEIYAFKRNPNFFFVDAKVFYKNGEPVRGVNMEVKSSKNGIADTMKTDNNGGIFFQADSLTNYDFAVRQEGYFAGVGTANVGGFEGKLYDTIHVKMFMDPIVINKPIRLENIYYDFDKSNIRPDAAKELDKLVKIMKDNPTIKVELGSHCDSRGSMAYNDRLSQRRADAAVKYIISQGISADRITAKGYGERVLLNGCSDGVKCTEEQHQLNRRTEFKVTGFTDKPDLNSVQPQDMQQHMQYPAPKVQEQQQAPGQPQQPAPQQQ